MNTTTAAVIGTIHTRDGTKWRVTEAMSPETGTLKRWAENDQGKRALFDGSMVEVKINLQTWNQLVTGHAARIIQQGEALIELNGTQVYSLPFVDIATGLREAANAIDKLLSFNVMKTWTHEEIRTELLGRPVWYWGRRRRSSGSAASMAWCCLPMKKSAGSCAVPTAQSPTQVEESLISELIYWWRYE